MDLLTIHSRCKRVQFTVIEALNLPKPRFRQSPNCHVSIRVDGQTVQTQTVKGENPRWNEVFVLDVQEGSVVIIQAFRDNGKRSELIAETTLHAAHCLEVEFHGIPQTLGLLTPGKPSRSKNAKLIVSCQCEEPAGGSTPSTVPPGQLVASTGPPVVLSSTSAATVDLKKDIDLLEQFLLNEKESVDMLTPPGIWTATMMGAVSSDNFGAVMGILERFVKIGDAITEVHPYAKLAWNVLTAAQKTLMAQQDRDQKVCDLWGLVLDTLDFMKQAEPPKEIQGLEKTVQAIMKQIYDCALFLRSYGKRCLVGECLHRRYHIPCN